MLQRAHMLHKTQQPIPAYTLHILQHHHEYGTIDKTMTLLKPVKSTSLLTPYEQFFIQSLGHAGRLIPGQNTGKLNHCSN
jgi:hypothetical protein